MLLSSFARLAGGVLALLVGDVLRVRRRHVESAMRRAGVGCAADCARKMYASLGAGLFELVLMVLFPRRLLATVEIPEPVLSRLRTSRRGCVVATAHTGNWDLVACALAQRVPLTVATKHFRIRWLDRLWQTARAERGLGLVGEGKVAKTAAAALGRREYVAMLVDQRPERTRTVTHTSFLGAPVAVDLAPALIAMRARVPLVVAFPLRTPSGHRVEVVGMLEPPLRAERRWAEATMVEVTRRLEAFVLDHPHQWLWMHRRWGRDEPASRGEPLPA